VLKKPMPNPFNANTKPSGVWLVKSAVKDEKFVVPTAL
jgi:hypothetical protein